MNESPLRNVEGFFNSLEFEGFRINTIKPMKEHYHQHHGCDGKMKHSTELAVQYHISENKKEGLEDYYFCEFCENYHTFTLPGMKKLSNKKHFRESEKRNKKEPRRMKLKNKPGRRKGKRKN